MTDTAIGIIAWIKANRYYARAVESAEYTEAVALREQALYAQMSLPGVESPSMPNAGDDIAAWLDAVVEADAAVRARTAKQAAITSLLNHSNSRITSVTANRDRLLRSLGHDLDNLMQDVAVCVERLGPARTPSEVIAAGVGDVWNELATLRAEYDKVRQAQSWVMAGELHQHRSNYLADEHASDVAIANLDKVFPEWRDKKTRVIALSGNEPDPQPWPLEPVAQLAWLSDSEAQVWIPTLRQLEALRAERRARLNPKPKKTANSPYPIQQQEYRRAVPITPTRDAS